jgi:hypothetical protein
MTIPSEALKVCAKCGEPKERADFYVRTNGFLQSACKACLIAKNKARRNGPDRETVLAAESRSAKAVRARTRDKVFMAYGGYRCVCCGETEPLFLTLDHINNDGGEFRKRELGKRTMAGYHTYRWLLRNGCPPVVQVLCMNCQHGKLMNNGICPHQGTCNDYPEREYSQAAGSAAPLN